MIEKVIDFGSILDGSILEDFGWLLASFLELYIRWVSKCDLRWILDDLGLQNERSKGVRRGSVGLLFGSWGGLRAKLAPRGLQDPSKRPLGTDFDGFWAQLAGFWLPIWWILDGFCSPFPLIFDPWPTNQPNQPTNRPINQSTHCASVHIYIYPPTLGTVAGGPAGQLDNII